MENNKIEKSTQTDIKEILNYYSKKKIVLWDIIENNAKINKNKKEDSNLIAWKFANQNNINYFPAWTWQGEKGSYVLTILNKWIKSGYENIKNCSFYDVEIIDLSNKYKQYENQRNTD